MTYMSNERSSHLNREHCDISITFHWVQLSFDTYRFFPALLPQPSTNLSNPAFSWILVLQTEVTFYSVGSTRLLVLSDCQYTSKMGGI